MHSWKKILAPSFPKYFLIISNFPYDKISIFMMLRIQDSENKSMENRNNICTD